jgi:hypothetical protein
MDDKKSNSTIQIIVAIIGATAVCIASIIGIFQPMVSRWVDNNFPTNTPLVVVPETPFPVFTTMPSAIDTPVPTLEILETAINDDLIGKHYIFGYTENDLAAKQILAVCKEPNCRVIFIKSLNELPDDWYHLAGNIGSATANLNDGCYSKQDLINLQVTHMQANDYTSCPAITPNQGNLFDNSAGRVYILGYTSQDISVQIQLKECNNCPTVYINSLDELPDNWYHYSYHVSSPTANLPDGCRTKQELINLGVNRVMMNNWQSCP